LLKLAAEPPCVAFFSEALLPTALGQFRVRVYRGAKGDESIALVCGSIEGREEIPVRVHSACMTSETFGSLKCDCRQQLDLSLEYIQRHGGIVIYLHQEGRGIGLGNKIRAYALQQQGHDTVSANEALDLPVDGRSYEAAHAILADLRVRSVRLMTNNPDKVAALRKLGVIVAGTIPVVAAPNAHSSGYLETKRVRMGHTFVAARERPYVHLNFALRPPGDEAGASGNISCGVDWKRVHLLRERYAAIAVGAATWCKDHPRLTAREEHLERPARRQPDPVIFMGSKSHWPQPDGRRMFVVGANVPRRDGFVGVEAVGHDLAGPLAILRRMRIDSMLVEGGATLLRSFLAQRMADVLTVYVSTPSAELAADCVAAQFPGLPAEMTHERYGAGTLLRWSLAS
jgi:GTP cyclohydrolase II